MTVAARRYATAPRIWPPRIGRELRFEMHPPSKSKVRYRTWRPAGREHRDAVRTPPINLVSDTALTTGGSFRFVDVPPGPAASAVHADGVRAVTLAG